MKHRPNSQFAFFNRRFLISLFFVLLSVSLALVGMGAISKGTGNIKSSMVSPQTAATNVDAQTPSKDAALGDRIDRYLDDKGNRATSPNPGTGLGVKHRSERPVGGGNWTSLGPPGGDVFDVAASTVDSNVVLAGLAPGGSFGGTLYRSSDGGNTWLEVPALDGT